MKRALIVGALAAVVLVLLALAALFVGRRVLNRPVDAAAPAASEVAPSETAAEEAPGFLYGRVTTVDGDTYEGRLRFGGDEEAFWDDQFNGVKDQNPWAAHVPPDRLTERQPIEIFGVRIATRESEVPLRRPFMVRFGDLVRMEASGNDVRVTLKSGSVFDLDRLDASDFDDGVRVWDGTRGVVDLGTLHVQSIELLPTARLAGVPDRLHGTVRTRQGDFTGFVQWSREKAVGTDELVGGTGDGEVRLRFDTVRSIERRSRDSALVTLEDGRELELSGTRDVGDGNRGLYVDDPRFGRVLVSWSAFKHLDLRTGGSGPAYGDFPPGSPLTGSVTTRDGRRLAGRLVFDLDESETTDTLDAPSEGLHYNLPFGLLAAIARSDSEEDGAPRTRAWRVLLHGGEELRLEPSGDLGAGNAGLLIFADGREQPEHVPWEDVERIDLDRPPAMYPQLPPLPPRGAASTAPGPA